METQQPPASTGDSGGSGGTDNSKLDDIFGYSNNNEDPSSTISALVGQLESSIESSLLNNEQQSSTEPSSVPMASFTSTNENTLNSVDNSHSSSNTNHSNTNSTTTSNGHHSSSLYNNNSMTVPSSLSSSSTMFNTLGQSNSVLGGVQTSPSESASSSSTANTNTINSNVDIGNGSNSTTMVGGKRIVLSANSQPVNSSITQQMPTTMMKLSPLTNGTMTPPQSPSLTPSPSSTTTNIATTTTSLKQQIPVGQQVALQAASSQSHVNNNSTISAAGSIRPPLVTPTPSQTSAISTPSNFVMTPNQNNKIMTTPTVAQKSQLQLLGLQQQTNGQQPMLLPTQAPVNNLIRPANVQLGNAPTTVPVSLNSMSIATPTNNLVLDPRSQQQAQLQIQQLSVSNAPGSNVQFQLQYVNSPSRPTLAMPSATATVSTGYTVSNIITGTNASIQTPSKGPLAGPRLVHLPPNVRLSGVRSAAPGFAAPLALPNHLVRGQTILFKTETGQVHMMNVGQTLVPGQSPTTPPTIRLQVPAGTPTPVSAVSGPGAGAQPGIRTQLAGSPIVLPVSLAQGVVNNTPTVMQTVSKQATPVVGAAPAAVSVSGTPVVSQQLSVHTTAANTQAAAAAPSQMSPTTAKKKCKNFLSTLIRLASDQPENVASNVKTLIQGLIDDTIQPEDFTNQLQRELNSSPQPCLVPFLKKSLPYLRYSLQKEELTIDGVRPPPANAMAIPSNLTHMAQLSHIQNIGTTVPTTPNRSTLPPSVRLLGPAQLAPNLIATAGGVPAGAQIITSLPPGNANASIAPIVLSSISPANQLAGHHPSANLIANNSMATMTQTMNTTSTLPHTRLPAPIHHHIQHSPIPQVSPQLCPPPLTTTKKESTSKKSTSKTKSKSEKPKKEKEKKDKDKEETKDMSKQHEIRLEHGSTLTGHGERVSSSFRDDDDINDVAAMGGVNLAEESQRILSANAEIIGQQIRSCKDEPFLHASPLHKKLNDIVKKFNLEECSHDVVALVSHATEKRLKTLVEQLGVIAEHRQEQFRNNPNYEIVQDVKGQAQFLQELDRIEKRRHEEQEREVLIKAAKSRSKVDDPDHIAIKARAKEMQRLELEEIRQREANETALQAIGNPKKRMKTMMGTSNTGTVGSGGLLGNHSSVTSTSAFGSGLLDSSNSTGTSSTANNLFNTFVSKPIKRIKRVTMKDVLFLMERDRRTVRSTILYKAYAR